MTSQEVNSRVGMIGGVLMSILPNLEFEDVVRTFVLATIGTTVSFFLTLFLRWLSRNIESKLKSKKK